MVSDKGLLLLNDYLRKEVMKLSTGSIMKSTENNLPDIDLIELGRKIVQETEPYEYLLEEGKEFEYLQKVGPIVFGPSFKVPERGIE